MARRKRSRVAGDVAGPSESRATPSERYSGSRAMITVDGEGLGALLAHGQGLQRATEDQLAGSLKEQWRLLQINAKLEDQIAALQEQVAALYAELDLLRGKDPATSAGDEKPPE